MQRVFMAPILQRKVEVTDRATGTAPQGFVGVVLVFDSEEAAQAWSQGTDPVPMMAEPEDSAPITH